MKSLPQISIRNSIATRLLRIVFSFYLVIAIGVTISHMIMEYRHQRNNISRDLTDIQKTFERGLAIDMWQLNQESLLSTVKGMLAIPVIVGVKIQNAKGVVIAVSGIIAQDDFVGNVGQCVNLLGLKPEEYERHDDETYNLDVFLHQFPIIYTYNEEIKQLGEATIYSNSSVVFRRVKMGFMLLLINAVVKTLALWLIFLWFSTFLLRKPLAALASAAEKIKLDNLESFRVDVETSCRNEITALAESFNAMIGNLHKSIVEREQSEEELQRLRTYLSNIIDSMPSSLIGIDNKGKVTQWNREAQKVTGVSPEDAIGQPLHQVFPHLASEMQPVREAIDLREIRTYLRRPHRINNETRYEDVTVYPLITNGVEGVVIRVDDVTERVRIEEMMVQSEKMLSVGGLAAGMAHEINNPLAAMIQTASVMANRLGERIDLPANLKAAEEAGITMEALTNYMEAREIPRMIRSINESGKRVTVIINDTLSFARQGDARKSSQDIVELINKTLELAAIDYDLKKRYDFRQITIVSEFEDNLPATPCERSKIQQVLLNILSNGAHAMQVAETEKPQFIIWTRFMSEREMIVIEIEDNGPGMDEATRKRVFEPFFTTKSVSAGTGLGLSVSYFIIVENHSGELTVESQPGQGAKFTIRLPI